MRSNPSRHRSYRKTGRLQQSLPSRRAPPFRTQLRSDRARQRTCCADACHAFRTQRAPRLPVRIRSRPIAIASVAFWAQSRSVMRHGVIGMDGSRSLELVFAARTLQSQNNVGRHQVRAMTLALKMHPIANFGARLCSSPVIPDFRASAYSNGSVFNLGSRVRCCLRPIDATTNPKQLAVRIQASPGSASHVETNPRPIVRASSTQAAEMPPPTTSRMT